MTRRRTGDLPSLREANRLRVLQELRVGGPVPQVDLARKTGLSPASVSNIVADALRSGLVTVTEGVRGRRVKLVSLSPALGLGVGIAIDHRHLTVALGNLSSELLYEATAEIDASTDPAAVIGTAARLTEDGLASTKGGEPLVAVGFTIPAPVSPQESGRLASPGGPEWWQMLSADWLRSRFGAPACIDNEANAAALAEWRFGAGSGCSDMLYVQIGDGVGSGLVLGGEMYRGARGWAGELGHVVLDENGPLCRCGHRGCFEALAGAPRVVDVARRSHPDISSLADLIARADHGDDACIAALQAAGTATGAAIAMAVNLLNPQRVVIGGLVMAAASIVMPAVRTAFEQRVMASMAASTELVVASLGANAGALGALTLAVQALPEAALFSSAALVTPDADQADQA
jgi:predicted NBD/HSP70 family sugar kinase